MNKLILNNYNLETTLLGGQAFNWDKIDKTYYGFFNENIIKIIQKKDYILWQTFPDKDNLNVVKKYLNIDETYEFKLRNLKDLDQHINKAISKYNGLRILHQDFEQTLLSFLLSSNKSIKGVRKAVRELSQKYGREVIVDNNKFYLFPKAEDLILLNESDLRNLGFGFRAKYFKNALDNINKNTTNENILIFDRSEDEVRDYLISFVGIGEKIADCIMTFSLQFNNITPIDVWGKRVLTDLYLVDPKLNYSEMRNWYKNYFGENTAIAGQYLFEYIRNKDE